MEDLKEKTPNELNTVIEKLGLAKFKAKEIFRFIHKHLKDDIAAITVLNIEERKKLQKDYCISNIFPQKTLTARNVQKVAFELADGKIIESVFMEYEKGRKTVCISTQVGCSIGCLFCATGTMGFKRNLSVGEILSQVYYFAKIGKIDNVVFMGMGEPFLNYNNVIKACRILNDPLGQNIAARKIVISTIGIPSGIEKLATEKEQFRLAWSLTPFKDANTIKQAVDALKYYQKKTGRRITIEYVALAKVNDNRADINRLIDIAKLFDCNVNLIPYNPVSNLLYEPGDIEAICRELKKAGINANIRRSLGPDIQAACGQLAS